MIQITEQVAQSVLKTIDAGLVKGVGVPIPGQMCVEAAVCYALGLPHGDDPTCVSQALRKLKIRLNDANWSSSSARVKGLRRLGIAQLGSAGVLDEVEFSKRVALMTTQTILADCLERVGLTAEATACRNATDLESALKAVFAAEVVAAEASIATASSSVVGTAIAAAGAVGYASALTMTPVSAAVAAADAASYAAYAADAVKSDQILSDWAERVVQILIDMKAPGTQWLYLTESE